MIRTTATPPRAISRLPTDWLVGTQPTLACKPSDRFSASGGPHRQPGHGAVTPECGCSTGNEPTRWLTPGEWAVPFRSEMALHRSGVPLRPSRRSQFKHRVPPWSLTDLNRGDACRAASDRRIVPRRVEIVELAGVHSGLRSRDIEPRIVPAHLNQTVDEHPDLSPWSSPPRSRPSCSGRLRLRDCHWLPGTSS